VENRKKVGGLKWSLKKYVSLAVSISRQKKVRLNEERGGVVHFLALQDLLLQTGISLERKIQTGKAALLNQQTIDQRSTFEPVRPGIAQNIEKNILHIKHYKQQLQEAK